MHAVAKLEVTERKFRVIEMSVERVEIRLIDGEMLPDLGIEAVERLEPMALVGVVQGFPKPGVADVVCPRRTGDQCRDARQQRFGG